MTDVDDMSNLILTTARGAVPAEPPKPQQAHQDAPRATETQQASTAAARLLELAASSADELVAGAKEEAATLVEAARAEAEELRSETQKRREQLEVELDEHRTKELAEIEERRGSLLAQVAKLRQLEEEHRDSMRRHLQEQLATLEEGELPAMLAVAGE